MRNVFIYVFALVQNTSGDPNRRMFRHCRFKRIGSSAGKLMLTTGFVLLLFLPVNGLSASGEKIAHAQQQSRTIAGRVTDQDGEAIIGASVKLKGTSTGTVTNAEGVFSLTLNQPVSSPEIEISYIGYRTETVAVQGNSPLEVVLRENIEALDEVVVVGYGTVKKRDLTGAVGSISSKKIIESPVVSAAEAIQGKVAGVLVTNSSWTPGATPSILIRGKRSINASNDPLYVVDGIPISTAPNLIPPGDIESIDVLKDASATAIYGSRGANGVIIITTKKGKSGKAQIDYNGYYGSTTIQNKLELMNGAEYAAYVRESYRAAGEYASDVPNIDLDKKIPSFTGDDYTWQSIAMAYDENGNYDPSKVRTGAAWWDEVERTGMVTDHQLSIRGGSDKTQYSVGLNYYATEGIYKAQDYNRYSVKVGIDSEVTGWLKVGGQSHFTHSLQHRGSSFQNNWNRNPLGRLYEDDGTPTLIITGTDTQMWNPLQYLVEGAIVNPLKVNRLLGSYYAEIKLPLDGLRFRTNVGLDFHSRQDYQFASSNARTGSANQAVNAPTETYACTNENLLFYDKQIGNHSLGVTLLQSIQRNQAESLSITASDLPSDGLLWNDIASASEITGYDSNNQVWSLASFMGRVNYNYKSKYYATLSIRYDGSSRLADGHKWVSFPAFALAWRINEEAFLKDFTSLNNLKLRAGYGVTANTAISPYQTKGTLGKKYYNYGSTGVIGYTSSSLPDKSLTWETTGQYNLGLDFAFFNSRVSGTIDAYVQNTDNLLLSRQLPVVSGYTSVLTNVGKTKNRGFESGLSTVNVAGKNFSWTTDFMYSTNKEEIVELYNGKVDDVGNKWFIGEAINVHYDYKKTGIWQDTPEDQEEMAKYKANGFTFVPGNTKLEDANGDYRINEEDRMIQGHVNPTHIFSLGNTFAYKGFDLSVIAYATAGGMLENGIRYNQQSYRNNNVKYNYWTPENPTNDYPRPNRLVDNDPYETALYYEKSDFLRIKTITLGYTLPQRLVNKATLSNCRFYFTAQNPFVFTKFTGVDPEGATTVVGSGYNRSYASPSYSSWIMGINLSF
ncbi:MAG: TonB-dependent receptor [Bacteroidales bacterium]|nr:TonB-dependent receptor [Bacteroidales bacterium]